jgi:hypothetical protein
MESPPNANDRRPTWAHVLLALGWLAAAITAVGWGLGRSSPQTLLGGGILPVLLAIFLQRSASGGQGRSQSGIASLIGAGLVLLTQFLVRMIANGALR